MMLVPISSVAIAFGRKKESGESAVQTGIAKSFDVVEEAVVVGYEDGWWVGGGIDSAGRVEEGDAVEGGKRG